MRSGIPTGRRARSDRLGRRGINEVHGEAGFKLNGSLLREGLVDELLIYLAPTLLALMELPKPAEMTGKSLLR